MDMVMNMKYKFSEEQYKEIKLTRKQNRDKQIEKRLQVLELRCEAGITEFHRSHVSSLIRKYFEEGLPAVSEKHYLGNHRNMSVEEEALFLEQFREMAEQGHMLDIHKIRDAYEKEVGHRISCAQVYRVLYQHGWRKVMPRSKHPKKANEEVIETSKKLTLRSNG